MNSTAEKQSDDPILQQKRAINCPRCGYDQRGIVATWTNTCPLQGVCSECGLTIVWAEVMQPEKYEPQWCVEFAPRPRDVPLACLKTYFRSFLPWRFWSRMKMSFPIRPRRLVSYIFSWMLPFLIVYVPLQTVTAVFVRYQIQQGLNEYQASLPDRLIDWEEWLSQTNQELLELNKDMPSEPYIEQLRYINQMISEIKNQIDYPSVIDHSYFEAIIEAVFLPLASGSWGRFIQANNIYLYSAPDDLYERSFKYLNDRTGILYDDNLIVETQRLSNVFAISITPLFLLPLAMILLPMSRKRAKVRWAHIWRVTTYSVFIPFTLFWLIFLTVILGTFIVSFEDTAKWIILLLMGYGPWSMLIVWWTFAIGRYLKIPHGFWVTTLFSLIIFLLLFAGVWWFRPEAVDDVFEYFNSVGRWFTGKTGWTYY